MDIRIDRVGARGDGIAETPDGPVFVPDALPGERARIGKTGPRGDGMRAVTREILETSPARVPPSCRHFGRCGGCAAQHMDAGLYSDWKRGLVESPLRRAGVEAEVLPPVSVRPATRRRVRMAFRSIQGGLVLGFREGQSDRIVDLAECAVATPAIMDVLPLLRGFLPRFAKRGEVAATDTETGLDVVVFAKGEPDLDLRMDAPQFCADAGICRLSWSDGDGDPEPIVAVSDPVVRFGDTAVSIPPDCFLQPTVPGETLLREFVTGAVADCRAVADLYAGCGAFSLPIAAMGKSVHAVEAVPAQTAAIQAAGGHRGVTVETRDLVRQPLRAAELGRFDAVILDPPRAGAAAQIEQLAAAGVPLIVHVSCNPATFARDARTLIDRDYAIGPVQPYDQFLWSHHIELAAVFRA
ncbi:MAG: class I SAM-dependent RNA methyltransferase [Alphaproteobacteria bacterium]